ncbi:hypothetical protein M405DRAFT_825093 [Rhizopogon salebrosus TDB-379]|nr:hypothetical protein M405DRAFT_825093 [Rhizopogon salebrosus TDB-379]
MITLSGGLACMALSITSNQQCCCCRESHELADVTYSSLRRIRVVIDQDAALVLIHD